VSINESIGLPFTPPSLLAGFSFVGQSACVNESLKYFGHGILSSRRIG